MFKSRGDILLFIAAIVQDASHIIFLLIAQEMRHYIQTDQIRSPKQKITSYLKK